jgi:hypothetical protein
MGIAWQQNENNISTNLEIIENTALHYMMPKSSNQENYK